MTHPSPFLPFVIVCLLVWNAALAQHGLGYMENYYLPPAPSTTPWAPTWSPDGRSIAFALYGSIWEMNLETGRAVELTYNQRYHSSPTWSPDGKWIVYTADDDKTIQLEILNVETGEVQALTSADSLHLDPRFSPDGSRLAYVSRAPGGNFNVYVRPFRDGRWAGPETAVTTDNDFGRPRLYFGRQDIHIQPSWLPNNAELLLVSNRGVPLGSGNIWRVSVQADAMKKATRLLEEQTLYRSSMDVSPDGTRFVYSSTAGAADQFNNLYILPTIGGAPYKLTFGSYDHFHPRWSPDGEWIAYISNKGGLPQLRLLETFGGRTRKLEITERRWKRPMGSLRVQVRDAETGRPTAARIYGLAADGKFYAPGDAYSRISILNKHLFHTEGEFTLEVPVGKMTIEAVKGFEYWPESAEVEILENRLSELVLTLRRMTNLAAKGWYSGSTHVHMNYGGNLHNTLDNLMMMSRAEDQQVVNELVANKDNRILDHQFFVPGGGEHPVSKGDPNMIVIVGEEYRPAFGGHVFLIGLRDHLVSPFTTGYEGTAIESIYPINTDIFRKALTQGAVTGYVHPFSGEDDPLEGNLGVAKYFPVDAAFGTIHGLEWSRSTGAALRVWHHALNNDLKVAPTGGEDSISDLHRSKLVGTVRTYAYLGSDFTAEAWVEALKQGRTFFTSGPLLDFSIDDRIPGESVRVPSGGGKVTVNGSVSCVAPMTRVVIYRNGKVWREVPLSPDKRSAAFEETVQVNESSWFSLTAEGDPNTHPLEVNYPQAATNAIRVYVGDQKIRNRESAEYFIRWIDKLKEMADQHPGWRSELERQRVFSQFDEARRIYQVLAEEAE